MDIRLLLAPGCRQHIVAHLAEQFTDFQAGRRQMFRQERRRRDCCAPRRRAPPLLAAQEASVPPSGSIRASPRPMPRTNGSSRQASRMTAGKTTVMMNRDAARLKLSQLGRDTVISSGGAYLATNGEAADIAVGAPTGWATVTLARDRLLQVVPRADDLVAATRSDPAGPASSQALPRKRDRSGRHCERSGARRPRRRHAARSAGADARRRPRRHRGRRARSPKSSDCRRAMSRTCCTRPA